MKINSLEKQSIATTPWMDEVERKYVGALGEVRNRCRVGSTYEKNLLIDADHDLFRGSLIEAEDNSPSFAASYQSGYGE